MEISKPLFPFKRSVLREDVKNYLISMIMHGKYKHGERIIETKIAKHLNISQAPVREAIRDLEQIGVLDTEPYRGTYVREFSEEDLKNTYDVREELEALAMRTAILHLQDEDLDTMDKILDDMVNALAIDDIVAVVNLDVKFHELIIKASQNKMLEKAWQTVNITYWTFLGFEGYKNDKSQLIGRHKPILEALRARDSQKAIALMRNHFSELRDLLDSN